MNRRLAGRLARTITRAHSIEATVMEVPRMDGMYVVGTREFGLFISPPPVIDPILMAYPDNTVPLKERRDELV